MKNDFKKSFITGVIFVVAFAVWTVLIQKTDVQPIGVNGTYIGFATLNGWFHSLIGVNMELYKVTDWLGLVPVYVCVVFGLVGCFQLFKRRNLLKVDFDIIVLGVYYVIVILCYLIFEMYPINYRPILINGFMEASYPSSTTLLVLCVMPTLVFQVSRRVRCMALKKFITTAAAVFSVFMVAGRVTSGVHWLTDIIGSCFFSAGLYYNYKGIVLWNSMKNFRF